MKWSELTLLALVAGLLGNAALAKQQQRQSRQPSKDEPTASVRDLGPQPNFKVTGPYTHQNLTIFLIHGSDAAKGKAPLTLQEALDQKKIVVHETENVNALQVENVSDTDEIFIQ